MKNMAPRSSFIKEIYNTVADAISQLSYDLKVHSTNEHNHATQKNVSMKAKNHKK